MHFLYERITLGHVPVKICTYRCAHILQAPLQILAQAPRDILLENTEEHLPMLATIKNGFRMNGTK